MRRDQRNSNRGLTWVTYRQGWSSTAKEQMLKIWFCLHKIHPYAYGNKNHAKCPIFEKKEALPLV
jgi:hypothetical protein